MPWKSNSPKSSSGWGEDTLFTPEDICQARGPEEEQDRRHRRSSRGNQFRGQKGWIGTGRWRSTSVF